MKNDNDLEKSIEEIHENNYKRAKDYLRNVNNADLSNYDKGFVDYYRKGTIKILGKVYKPNSLFIEKYDNKVILYDKNNIGYDLLTSNTYDKHKIDKFRRFRNSNIFYDLYLEYKNNIVNNELIIDLKDLDKFISLLSSFDGSIHDKVPETYYRLHM